MRLYEKKTAAQIRFFAVAALVLCLFALQGISADGRFVSMHGKVQVFENGRWAKAEMSSKLTEQSSVQVGYRSGAVVGLKDGSQIAMKPNSVVSFNHLSDDVKKPRSEIFVVQGGLSAFVKKPEGNAKHVFHIRTPTMIVGVRGSFMELSKNGELHQVTAVQSPAFMKNDPTQATTRERLQKAFAVLERAYLMDRDEKLRVERRIREAKNTEDAEALRLIVNPTFETAEIKEGIKNIDTHKILTQELLIRQKKIYTTAVSDRKELVKVLLSVRALTMIQLAWAEAAYRAELEAHLVAMKQNEKKKQAIASIDNSVAAGDRPRGRARLRDPPDQRRRTGR
ncbi:MAG: FecR domain-containing protein, partial [Spirochaetes bacterium]|nr:FecR domain-containing protein [Spirochaetota bacterium]